MFELKDSGKRIVNEGGMVRDVADDKVDYSLVFDGPMLERWAKHLTLGAQKYTKRNWMKATSQAEKDRFRESAVRHFVQWLRGDVDEDHAAAVMFNINGAEFVQVADGEPQWNPMGKRWESAKAANTNLNPIHAANDVDDLSYKPTEAGLRPRLKQL